MEGKDTKHSIERSCTECNYSSRISEDDADDLVDGQPKLKLYENPPLRTEHVLYCKWRNTFIKLLFTNHSLILQIYSK